MEKKMEIMEENLRKNGFNIRIFKNVEEAKKALLEEIPVDKSIGFGGSVTLSEMGIYEDFKERGNEIFWHWKVDNKKEEIKKADNADIYMTSTNAITEDGKIVNMDGTGNRLASMFYGHEIVYIIAGKNKICKNYEEARDRIRNIAGPKNAQRLDVNTPCKITGKCSDCNSTARICNVEVIIHKNTTGSNINIFVINEDLGF